MVELKTLKEIPLPSDGCNCDIRIRQEIIRWIKDIYYTPLNESKSKDMFEFGNERVGAVKILKHIFNISEEELK